MICNIVPQLVYPSTTNTLVRLNATSALTRDGLSQLELDVGMLSTMKTLPSAVGLSKADTAQDVETFITLLDKVSNAVMNCAFPSSTAISTSNNLTAGQLKHLCVVI